MRLDRMPESEADRMTFADVFGWFPTWVWVVVAAWILIDLMFVCLLIWRVR